MYTIFNTGSTPPLRFHCTGECWDDAGIEPRTVSKFALAVRCSNHSALISSTARLDLVQHYIYYVKNMLINESGMHCT